MALLRFAVVLLIALIARAAGARAGMAIGDQQGHPRRRN